MAAELRPYPEASYLLVLSPTCLHSEAFEVIAQTRAVLSAASIDLTGEQHTNTRAALEYFWSGGAEMGQTSASDGG